MVEPKEMSSGQPIPSTQGIGRKPWTIPIPLIRFSQRPPDGPALCAVFYPGDPLMPVRDWQAVLLALVVLCGLGGCSGNYKYNDNTYRPLGDPQAVNRGK